jgi:GTPase
VKKKQVLLISIIPQSVSEDQILQELTELKSLVQSYGAEVADVLTQRREVHDKGLYIGTGKIAEAYEVIKQKRIDIVVLNGIIKPGHLYDMKSTFFKANRAIEVWDRIDLILEIFSLHAKTAESRLQIELAAMRHMGPRIYGMGMELSRQAGGIGGRGIGETNTERMKRHWREQMKKTEEKLAKLALERERQLRRREKSGMPTASIIGYTNAGKTTLFNMLTGKKKYARDELFATLDSTVGKIYLPHLRREILLSDTIGFIQNLPTNLIEAFKSTLLESTHADLLLHVIDSSDPYRERKIAIVEEILDELSLSGKPQMYVFSKTDLLQLHEKETLSLKYGQFTPQFISVLETEGIRDLTQAIEERFTHHAQVI